MTTPLLSTKLYVPAPRSGSISRPRLTAHLDASCKLTLVSAPAGFGKTTLVAEWITDRRWQAASDGATGQNAPLAIRNSLACWLSLDTTDNEPSHFWTYLIAALQTAVPQVGKTPRAMLQTPQPPPIEMVLTDLINEIAALAVPLILVLDDYHLIESSAIHEEMTFLLDHLPPQLRLVILTRADPPLPLARMRVRGQLTELRADDLRFMPDEAAAFLNDAMGLTLTVANIAALDARIEGWIAGLQMAALSMQGLDESGIAYLIAGFSGRYHFILDYLTDEVLQRQPPPVQRFLLTTSILESMCGDLCDALEDGAHHSQMLLAQLHHANLFLMPLDAEHIWYRYHRLFSDLLRARLRESRPDAILELHRRAATWYDRHGLASEAIHHALAAKAYGWAADMLERTLQNPDALAAITTAHLQGWLDSLPDEVLQSRPRLQLTAARVFYVTGRAKAAERLLQTLERALQDRSPDAETTNLVGLLTVDRASYAAMQGYVHRAIELARQALAHLPEDSLTIRMRAASVLGLAYFRAGNVAAAGPAFSQAIAAAQAAGIAFAAALFACNLADVQIVQGQLRQAMRTCQQAMDMGTADGRTAAIVGYVELAMAKILYERNDLQSAAQHATEGLAHLEQAGTPDSFGTGHALLARIQQAQGCEAQALVAIQKAQQIARQCNVPRLVHLMSAYQARMWLAQGQRALAACWAQDYQQLDATEYLREFEDLTLVRVFLAEGRLTEALAWLDRLQAPAEEAGRMSVVLETLLLQAVTFQAQGNLNAALAALHRALALAAPEGHVRLFADEGQTAVRLLSQINPANAKAPLVEYSRRLLLALGHPADGIHPFEEICSLYPRAPQSLIEPLSDRELQVLHLLAEGLTNAEIAQRLYISLPTVKSHARSIYGKLGVHNRRQAVIQARATGLIL
ncbi:MAG: hypothetical protein JW934_23965 [Anaerolineae bacterium]|nr:hypothetical protein [Anaerolineae bacterium]